jgi:hypothetical protein
VLQSRTEITGTPKKAASAIPIQTRQRDERFDTTKLYCVMHDKCSQYFNGPRQDLGST